MDFSNKTALITGGSSGIGLELAKAFHKLGVNVVLVARRKDLLEKECALLNSLRSNSASFLEMDLSSILDIYKLSEIIKTSSIDILTNNAGFGSFGRLETLDPKREERMVILNCLAPILLSQAVIPQMKERHNKKRHSKEQFSGAIINLSSLAGLQPLPYMATYAATKAFDYSFSLAICTELKSFGITVSTICPGPVETEFAGVARVPGEVTGSSRDPVDEVVRDIISGLEKGALITIPGRRGRLVKLLVSLIPFRYRLWLMEKVLHRTLVSASAAAEAK